MVFDLITVALFVLIVAAGVIKGAAKMILGLAATFISFLAASWLGKLLAGVLYDAFCAPAVGSAVEDSASSAGDLVDNLPFWAEKALHLSGRSISLSDGGTAVQLTDRVNDAVRPIAVGVMAILLTLLLFFVINLILRKFVLPLILKVFRLPFVRRADQVLGGMIGAVEAIVVICMLAYLLKLVLPHIDTDVSFLNESTIYNSFIFYHFYSGNIFTVLSSWI